MNSRKLTNKRIADFQTALQEEERSDGTIEKYLRDVRAFACWLDEIGRAHV